MLKISDMAADTAKKMLEEEGKAGFGLRIYLAGGGCCGPSYGMDIDEHPADGDDVVEKNGLKVFLDKNTSESLKDMEIDYIEEGEAQGFIIKGGAPPSCSSTDCSSCG